MLELRIFSILEQLLDTEDFDALDFDALKINFFIMLQMKDFVKTRISNQGSAKQIIKQSEEKIKARIEWISRNEKTVEECLKKRVTI